MSKHDDFDGFDDSIGEEVARFLNSISFTNQGGGESDDASKEESSEHRSLDMSESSINESPAYIEVKKALEEVFEMCSKHGFSIQVAIADDPVDQNGDKRGRITLCGRMVPHNVPCEMVAAAAVYQAHHLFSHMVLAMASAGSDLINPEEGDK